MIERVCKVPHQYAGRQVEVGERFAMEPADVDLALAMGRIERASDDKVPGFVSSDRASSWPNTYTTRDMVAARPAQRRKGARA